MCGGWAVLLLQSFWLWVRVQGETLDLWVAVHEQILSSKKKYLRETHQTEAQKSDPKACKFMVGQTELSFFSDCDFFNDSKYTRTNENTAKNYKHLMKVKVSLKKDRDAGLDWIFVIFS